MQIQLCFIEVCLFVSLFLNVFIKNLFLFGGKCKCSSDSDMSPASNSMVLSQSSVSWVHLLSKYVIEIMEIWGISTQALVSGLPSWIEDEWMHLAFQCQEDMISKRSRDYFKEIQGSVIHRVTWNLMVLVMRREMLSWSMMMLWKVMGSVQWVAGFFCPDPELSWGVAVAVRKAGASQCGCSI